MSTLPIACTLSASDLAAARDRYRAAANHYRATARITDTSATISLTGDPTFLRTLLDEMVDRESGCCAFLTIDPSPTETGFDVKLGVCATAGLAPALIRESVTTLFPSAAVDDRRQS